MPSAVLLQFIGTFGVWIVAERLHLSAILTVVLYGMTLGRLAPLADGGVLAGWEQDGGIALKRLP